MCLTPERRKAWLKRLGKPEDTAADALSDDALIDEAAGEFDATQPAIDAVTARAETAEAEVAALSAALADKEREVLSLSAAAATPRTVDPDVLKDRADNYRDKVRNLVDRGDMPQAVADKILAAAVPAAGPSVLMLTGAADLGGRRPVDVMIGLFDGAELGVAHNDATRRAAVVPAPSFPSRDPAALALSGAGGGNGDLPPDELERRVEANLAQTELGRRALALRKQRAAAAAGN